MPFLKSDNPKREQAFNLIVGQGTARHPETGRAEPICSIDLPDNEMIVFAMDEVASFISCLSDRMRSDMAAADRNRDN